MLTQSNVFHHMKMTTKYFCMSNSRRITLRRIASLCGIVSTVCVLFHWWYNSEQNRHPPELDQLKNWRLETVITTHNVNTSVLIKLPYHNTYILSAILPDDQLYSTSPAVIVNVFDASDVTFFCCVLEDGQTLRVTSSTLLRQFHHNMVLPFLTELFYSAPYPARQITCPLVSPVGSVTHISLSSSTCSPQNDQYTPIVHATDHTGELAVCAKVAYNDALKPYRLVEWLEFQKLMGVDKVVIFTLDVTQDVRDVFDFYVKQGLLVTVPYQIPASTDLRRSMRPGNRSYPQFRHDEQLPIFDCRERLSGYSHVAGIDLDEIIIPRSRETLKELLQTTLSKLHPDAGAYYFYQAFHITEWSPSHPENSLTTMRYLKTDPPHWESEKYVYVPRRTEYARTHEVVVKPRFKSYIIQPEVAVIHHFRSCPWSDCHNRRRVLDNSTLQYQKQMEQSVRTIMKELNKKS